MNKGSGNREISYQVFKWTEGYRDHEISVQKLDVIKRCNFFSFINVKFLLFQDQIR